MGASRITKEFNGFYISYVIRQQNVHADALTSLAVSLALFAGASEKNSIFTYDLYCPRPLIECEQASTNISHDQEVLATSTDHMQRDWKFLFTDFYIYGILPDDLQEVKVNPLRLLKTKSFILNERLTKWRFSSHSTRCSSCHKCDKKIDAHRLLNRKPSTGGSETLRRPPRQRKRGIGNTNCHALLAYK